MASVSFDDVRCHTVGGFYFSTLLGSIAPRYQIQDTKKVDRGGEKTYPPSRYKTSERCLESEWISYSHYSVGQSAWICIASEIETVLFCHVVLRGKTR
jgi:hypothetical protein